MFCSKALFVYYPGSLFLVVALTDPHGLEGVQTGEDGAADPHREFTFRGRDYFASDRIRSQYAQL